MEVHGCPHHRCKLQVSVAILVHGLRQAMALRSDTILAFPTLSSDITSQFPVHLPKYLHVLQASGRDFANDGSYCLDCTCKRPSK